MAELSQSPTLPSTADTTPYVPVSWMAVAALTVAGLFAIILLLLGITAFINKKPLLMQELLILPVIGIVLSFAARRMIRNSEGTRTGENLAVSGWWLSLILGLSYVAYLLAIDYSVRRDAALEVKRWVELVQAGEEKSLAAFRQTLAPGQRQAVDDYEMEKRFASELLGFRNADLMRLMQRNHGEAQFDPGSVVDWSYKPGTIDCTIGGTVKCVEGTFPILVPLKAIEGVTASEGGTGRQWMIVRQPNYIQQDKAARTSYGWLLLMLEIDGGGFGRSFINQMPFGPGAHPYLYQAFIAEGGDIATWLPVARNPYLSMAFSIPLSIISPADSGYTQYLANHFYKKPGGGEPTPAQREKFVASWNAQGLFEAGRRLKDPTGNVPDKENIIKVTDTAVEVHIPIELPLLNSAGKPETARGRLVVACKDPALLAELKERKAAAASEKPATSPAEELTRKQPIPWRVVRIESDLHPVQIASPTGPGGMPGGPGGMPGH